MIACFALAVRVVRCQSRRRASKHEKESGHKDESVYRQPSCKHGATGQEFAEPHEHLAMLLEASGDTEGAIPHLQEAIRINPNLAGARRQLDALMRGR